MKQNEIIEKYYSSNSKEKVKKYGQYFTPQNIAKFMADWISEIEPKSILDPSIGNNIFICNIEKKDIHCKGYDVDKEVVEFFNNYNKCLFDIDFSDYLLNGWDEKWDAIVANPPYNRFQNIDNKEEIRKLFKNKIKIDLNGYTNQYALFLVKSLYELKDYGRLAYIIPTEFMNLEYGSVVRKALCEKGYLSKIIVFDTSSNKNTLFNSAITTSCIVLVEKKFHEFVSICKVDYFENKPLDVFEVVKIKTNEMLLNNNWKTFYSGRTINTDRLVIFEKYIKVSRGIATGDNKYFLFNKEKKEKYNLSDKHFYKVICKAPYISKPFFTEAEFNEIVKSNKDYLLFDGTLCKDVENELYLQKGQNEGILNKYLVASRKIWYESENKSIAPIWFCGNSREKIKVVRNIMGIKNLTTFHGLFVKEKYLDITNIIFCFLLTKTSQSLFEKNKKEYAGGLNKFQPGDIQHSFTIDFEKIEEQDINKINGIYETIKAKNFVSDLEINSLDEIFKVYL